jgi:hypothetical protein
MLSALYLRVPRDELPQHDAAAIIDLPYYAAFQMRFRPSARLQDARGSRAMPVQPSGQFAV